MQGLFNYQNKIRNSNPELFKSDSQTTENCTFTYSKQIELINGKTPKRCLESKSLVYIWKPNCHGKFCYSLNIILEICNEKEIELYIVAEYYDAEKLSLGYKIDKNIFGTDTRYYKSNRTKVYLSKFLNDLSSNEVGIGNFLYFKNKKLSRSFNAIDSISLNN